MNPDRTYPASLPAASKIVAEGHEPAAPIADPLEAVVSGGSEAWPQFLEYYTPFILSCIRRFAGDADERMEIYVHVCERLRADDCRRIRQYRGVGSTGPCKFTTWLAAVVFNLAREWIRSTRGRRRLFRSVRQLSRTNRLVFQYYFWDGYTRVQIATLLRMKHHIGCSTADVTQRLADIERRLSRDHRWRLVTGLLRTAGPVSIDRPRTMVGEEIGFELPDRREGGTRRLEREDANRKLQDLVAALPDEERLAIVLRFERGMPAREVAAAIGIRNHKRVYEIQGRALERLAEGLRRQGLELRDFLTSDASPVRGSR